MMKHISKTEDMRKQKLKVKGFRWENKMGLKAFPTGMPWEKTGAPWEKTGAPWGKNRAPLGKNRAVGTDT